jgi:tetratricopeptide (TPR) repeat protein
LHNRVGKLLEQHYENETAHIAAPLAMHFERGRNFARAIHYLTLVGDNSAKVYANAEAVEHYTRALDLTQKLSIAAQEEARLKLHLKRGAVEAARSRFNQARDDFTRVVDGARAVNAREMEQAALNGLIKVLFFARQLDEVARRTDEALALAAETKNESLRLETLAFIVQKHIRSREWAEAVRLVEQIIEDASVINHRPALLSGLVMRGELHFQQSEYEPAEELLTRAVHLASEISDGFMHLYSLFFLGLVAGNTGRMSRSLEVFNEAARIAERNGDRFWLARLPSSLGWIYRELHDFERALEHDYQGLEIARADNLPEVEANALLNFCQEYARRNDSEKWLATFREIEEIIERNPWMRARYHLRLQSVIAEYQFALGQFELAEEHAGQLLELTTQYGYHKDEAVARKLLAETRAARGLAREAEAELKRALVVLEKHHAPLVAWRVHAALGRLYLHRQDKRAAHKAYAEAGRIIEKIAASVNDEQLRKTFLAASAVRDVLDAPGVEI